MHQYSGFLSIKQLFEKEVHFILIFIAIGFSYFIVLYHTLERGDVYVYSWFLGGASIEGKIDLKDLSGFYSYLYLLWKTFFPKDYLSFEPYDIISPPAKDFLIVFMFLRFIMLITHFFIIYIYSQTLFPFDKKFRLLALFSGIFTPLAFLGLRSTFKREIVMLLIESTPLVLNSRKNLLKVILILPLLCIGIIVSPIAIIAYVACFGYYLIRSFIFKKKSVYLFLFIPISLFAVFATIFGSGILSFLPNIIPVSLQYSLDIKLVFSKREFFFESLIIIFFIILLLFFITNSQKRYEYKKEEILEAALITFVAITAILTLLEILPLILNYLTNGTTTTIYRRSVYLISDQFPIQIFYFLFGLGQLILFRMGKNNPFPIFDNQLLVKMISFSLPLFLLSRIFEFSSFIFSPDLGIGGPDLEHFGSSLFTLIVILLSKEILNSISSKNMKLKNLVIFLIFLTFSIPIIFREPLVFKFEYILACLFFLIINIVIFSIRFHGIALKTTICVFAYILQSFISPNSFVFSLGNILNFCSMFNKTKFFKYFFELEFVFKIILALIFLLLVIFALNCTWKSRTERIFISFSLLNLIIFYYCFLFNRIIEETFFNLFYILFFLILVSLWIYFMIRGQIFKKVGRITFE